MRRLRFSFTIKELFLLVLACALLAAAFVEVAKIANEIHAQGVALSVDGSHLSTGLLGTDLGTWDLANERRHKDIIRNFHAAIYQIILSADGALLACGTSNQTTILDSDVAIWDVASQTQVGKWKLPIRRFALSADGSRMAGAMSDGSIKLFDVKSQALQRSLAAPGSQHNQSVGTTSTEIADLQFSPDDQFIASLAVGEEMTVWDVASGAVVWNAILQRHRGNRTTYPKGRVAYCLNGEAIVIARDIQYNADEVCVDVLAADTGELLESTTTPGHLGAIAIACQGRVLALLSDQLYLFDVPSLHPRPSPLDGLQIADIAASPASDVLAFGLGERRPEISSIGSVTAIGTVTLAGTPEITWIYGKPGPELIRTMVLYNGGTAIIVSWISWRLWRWRRGVSTRTDTSVSDS